MTILSSRFHLASWAFITIECSLSNWHQGTWKGMNFQYAQSTRQKTKSTYLLLWRRCFQSFQDFITLVLSANKLDLWKTVSMSKIKLPIYLPSRNRNDAHRRVQGSKVLNWLAWIILYNHRIYVYVLTNIPLGDKLTSNSPINKSLPSHEPGALEETSSGIN